jgi:hypothetical protein
MTDEHAQDQVVSPTQTLINGRATENEGMATHSAFADWKSSWCATEGSRESRI